MPTYDYKCEACGHTFEEFQSITADPLRKCPSCKKKALKRLIGAGAGVIFKGSGFYSTDYRSSDYKSRANSESSGSSTPSTKTEPKKESKKEPKKEAPAKCA